MGGVFGSLTVVENTATLANFEMILGSTAADAIIGGAADEDIDGRGGNDVINGGGGNDLIRVEDGHDDVSGGAGDDRILVYGNATVDMTGGAGADEFEFVNGGISASGLWGTITDFSHADGDRINILNALQFIGDENFGVWRWGEVRVEQILGDAVALVGDRPGRR